MPEKTRIGLCTSLLARIFESNRELLLELQFNNAISRYRNDHPILEKLVVNDDLTIDASQMPDSEVAVAGINSLINAARSIMEIFVGGDEAESRILEPAKEFLAEHQIDAREAGLIDSCPGLGGLSVIGAEDSVAAISFGIRAVDDAFRNDLKSEHALLIQGRSGIERDIVLALFVKEGLKSGGVIYATSTEPPDGVEKRLELLGIDIEKHKSDGTFVIIDWFSKNMERVQGVERTGNWVKCSGDPTNVGVAFDLALRSIRNTKEKRAVVDFLSPSIMTFDYETMLDFITAIQAKLRENNCFSLVTFNKEMHTRQEASAVRDIFDGVIDIDRYFDEGVAVNDIGVTSFSGFFEGERTRINIDDRGVWFGNEKGDADKNRHIVSPGVSGRITAGMSGLEMMTGGGLLRGRSYLVLIPPGTFPLDIVNQLSIDILKQDFAVSISVSTPSPAEIIARLHEGGLVTTGLLSSSVLRIVDWQSQKNQRVMGVDDRNGVLSASKDIMHLGVAMDMAVNQLDSDREAMAVVETLSYSLREYDLRTVYQFVQTLRAKFRKRGITSYFIMEIGTQDRPVISALEELFDGVIEIVNAGGRLAVGISSMKDTNYMGIYKPLTRLRSGLSIEITESVSMEEGESGRALEVMEDEMQMDLEKFRKEREELEARHNEVVAREKELMEKMESLKTRIELFESERKRKVEHRQELAAILEVLDDLLGKLPDEHIDEFASSPDFARYEKIMDLYLGGAEENDERSNEDMNEERKKNDEER